MYLIILFTLVPLIELALLIKVGTYLGVSATLAIVALTGIFGAYLARWQGLSVLNKIQQQINQGQIPTDELFDGLIILMSGILLLTPGLLTDTIGFAGLIPLTRNLLKAYLRNKADAMVRNGQTITITNYRSS